MKKCPYCAESIQEEATKCKHCGEWLESKVKEIIRPIEKNKEAKFEFKKIFLWWAGILSIALIIFFLLIEADGDISTIIFSSIFLAVLLSVIATIIHRHIFERKYPPIESFKREGSKDFLERDTINEADSNETVEVKKQWNNFTVMFWLLFFMKMASGGGSAVKDQDIIFLLLMLQFFSIGSMVILMGYYSYKFSGKKVYWLFGLLGFLWIFVVGIFIGFWQVQKLKNEKLGIKGKARSFKLS